MSNAEYALVSFGAAFAGAAFSLLLWFGTNAYIRWMRNKKVRKALMQEILEELQFDIALLVNLPRNLRQVLDSGNVPLKLSRLTYSASSYALASGEVRLIPNLRKRRLVRLTSAACERFNEFIDNTERLLAIFTLKDDGLTWSVYRIDRLIEQADATKSLLEDYLGKLQGEDLPDEYVEATMTTENSNDPERQERRLERIENGIDKILTQIKESQGDNTSLSLATAGIAFMAIALAILSLGSVNAGAAVFFLSFIILSAAAWYRKERVHQQISVLGAIITILGSALLMFTQFKPVIGATLATVGILLMTAATVIYTRKMRQ